MDERQKIERAKRQVEALTGLYIHLTIFVLVMLLLLVINIATGTPWWVQWPFLGWGVGVLGHAAAVHGQTPNFIRDWQIKKMKELKDKM